MRGSDVVELVTLAALWGASFLFTRIGAGEFGPAALVFLRVAGATLLLLPLALARGQGAALHQHWRPIAVVGFMNSALPFALFAIAALVLNAGLSAIFNGTAPLWVASIAWLTFGEKPVGWRLLGLALGFAGVAGLGGSNASFKAGEHGVSPALGIAACVGATVCYGIAAHFTRRRLAGVPPLAVAAGSQVAATLMLALPALWLWPSRSPTPAAWGAVAVLAFVCTGCAYLLYFRLIAHAGPSNAIAVTYLIPAFGVLWGTLFLHEPLTLSMVLGCGVILLGTALATGLVAPRPGAASR